MQAQDLANAAAILALKTEAEQLTKRLNEISLKLNYDHGMDLKVASWDWSRPGWTTSLSSQGALTTTVVNISDRPK